MGVISCICSSHSRGLRIGTSVLVCANICAMPAAETAVMINISKERKHDTQWEA